MNAPRRRATQGLGGLGSIGKLEMPDEAPAAEPATDERGRAGVDSQAPVVERLRDDLPERVREELVRAPTPVPPPPPEHVDASSTAPVPQRRRRTRERRVGMDKRYNGEIARTTITLPAAVDDAIAEIVFSQRKTTRKNKNDLMLEGIELLLKKYGKGSIGTLVAQFQES